MCKFEESSDNCGLQTLRWNRLMEDMDTAKACPVLCCYDTEITEHQKTLFTNLNILGCNSGVNFIECYDML